MPDYSIEFSIQRRNSTDDDYTEVGFGSTGGCADLDQAAHAVQSLVQHREWETTDDMLDPDALEESDA